MNQKLIIPKQHIDLFISILDKMGVTDFKENKNKYSPDFSFSVESELFWGYKKGFVIEFNGSNLNSLQVINSQYEYVIKQLEQQENKD